MTRDKTFDPTNPDENSALRPDNAPIEPVKPDAGDDEAPEKGMTTREAVREAIKKDRGETPEKEDAPPTKAAPEKPSADEIACPQEFSPAGKEAWQRKDINGIQKEYRRIHDLRTQEITRAQNEAKKAREDSAKETQTWREFAQKVKLYIEARGKDGVNPETAIIEAMNLVDSFRSADPATAKAELKRIGIDLDAPAKAQTTSTIPKEIEDKINSLQSFVENATQEREAQKFQQLSGMFNSIFEKMGGEKGRTGQAVYLDLNDGSEEGIGLAKRLGSFALNPEFQAGVLRRFPGADFERVCREAYLAAGGRVSSDTAKVSPEQNQKHIERSRRAAAASPGRGVVKSVSSTKVGKLSRLDAVRLAIEEDRQRS